ncbi:hypothetical protein JCM10908_006124 [Rhodotorula pacifica]|uniref:uncharacterized protein n=1 Tax=Rhodotorula pacifica TaxID=1495444 RepID=UPI0031807B7F
MVDATGGSSAPAVPAGPSNLAQLAATRLTTPSGRASAALGGPKPKKRRKKKPEAPNPTIGRPRGGRVVLPTSASTSTANSSAAPAAVTPTTPQPRSRKKLRSGRKPLPSQGKAFQKGADGGPSTKTPSAPAPPPASDSFTPVASQSGQVAFTRPRGDVLNSSIASVLGRRPAEVLEEHQRELRTKRQKTAAEALRREILMDVDDSSADEDGGESVLEQVDDAITEEREQGGEAPSGEARVKERVGAPPSLRPDASVEDADIEDLIIHTSSRNDAAGGAAASTAASSSTSAAVDIFGAGQKIFPPPKPFMFPVSASADKSTAPSVTSECVAQPGSCTFDKAALTAKPLAPTPAEASSTRSSDTSAQPPTSTTRPFDDLPKALPLLPGAQPKLNSAAAVLAGKRRKKKPKLNRAPQLFDYFSDEMSDEWEDKEDKYKAPKRPKDGRAVDGRLETGEDGAGGKAGSAAGSADRPQTASTTEGETSARKLVPTSYQSALLERAKETNILTVLSTGSGKTFVAVLLIECLHAQEVERLAQAVDPQPRMIFFLTNSVPLVHQQADVLARNTSLRVGKLFGALGVNLCSPSEWKYNFESYDCLVVTSQLLLDSLAHGFIRMDQISLLVFDEAHHAKSNNPFASILRDFYHRAPLAKRPRILGLTASPLDSNEGVEEAKKLEALFDAKLVTAPPETQAELRAMVARPTVLCIDYDPPPEFYLTDLHLAILDKVVVRDESFSRCILSAEGILRSLGPDAADLVWHLALQRYKAKLLPHVPESSDEEDGQLEDESETLGAQLADTDLQDATPKPVIESGREARKLTRVEQKRAEIKQEKERMKRELKEKMLADARLDLPEWLKVIEEHKPTLEYERLSPKLQKLLDVLKSCKSDSEHFRGIVFVERRVDALVIAEILKILAKRDDDLDWLRVDCVTGHGVSRGGSMDPKMPWHRQASVLARFGEGQVNLLLATSVCEEGMDIQPCKFIVRFDLYQRHVSMIQSKGRARAPGSHYVLFCEKGNVAEKRKLLQIARFDENMFELFDEAVGAEDEEADDEHDFFGAANERCSYFIEPSTGATLTPHSALGLLQRYARSLPRSDEFSISQPQYTVNDFGVYEFGDRQFSCTVVLPSASKVRVVTGPLCANARIAKREAAFSACRVLRNVGSLDEHLLPLRTLPPEEVVEEGATEPVGSKKRQVEYERKLADVFVPRSPCAEETTYFVTALHFGGAGGAVEHEKQLYRPLFLLTRNAFPTLPAMTMFLSGESLDVLASPVGSIDLNTAQRKMLAAFQIQLWQSVLNKRLKIARGARDGDGKRGELDLVYLLGIPSADFSVEGGFALESLDWALMERAVAKKEQPLDWKDLSMLGDSVIVDQAKNGCRYFFERVMPDLRPFGPLPAGRQSDAGFTTLMDYYLSFNDAFFHSIHVEKEQPLIELSKMPKTVTHLTRTPRNDVTPNPKKLVSKLPRLGLPQTCLLHFLPASVFRTALMLPSIMTDLEQRCLVEEFNAAIFAGRLAHEHVRTALTSPSAATGGLDYNRLELLGDSILKHLVSTFVFVSQDRTTHEGIMHRLRLELVNNRYLFEAGKRHGVPAVLLSRPFTSRHFVPPNLILADEKDKAPPSSAVIGDKTIADAVEALVGAAVETGFDRSGLHEAFSLALMTIKSLGIEIGTVTDLEDFPRLYGVPGEVRAVVSEYRVVENTLGYVFRHGALLREAFTHPSKLDEVSFERTEWLGDSVLDFHVVRYCWHRWSGDLGPGHLTELKGACVSNETLAALAVDLDLDRFLVYDHPQLETNMRLYRERIVAAKEKELLEAEQEVRDPRPYWLTLDPPKAVADIIESLFGAVYIDSGFDPVVPQQLFDEILAPFFAKWISPTKLKIDAIRVLLETAQASQCDDISHVSSTLEARFDPRAGELVQRLTRCSVVAHNMVLGSVETANAKTAKRLASSEALQYLNLNPGFFPSVCDCPTRRALAKELAAAELERRRQEGLISESESEESDADAPREGQALNIPIEEATMDLDNNEE